MEILLLILLLLILVILIAGFSKLMKAIYADIPRSQPRVRPAAVASSEKSITVVNCKLDRIGAFVTPNMVQTDGDILKRADTDISLTARPTGSGIISATATATRNVKFGYNRGIFSNGVFNNVTPVSPLGLPQNLPRWISNVGTLLRPLLGRLRTSPTRRLKPTTRFFA